MAMIEIRDAPVVHLAALLDLVEDAEKLDWTVMKMWATGRDDSTDVVALEREVAEAPRGVTMSAAAMRELAGRLLQVIDGIVVGHHDRQPERGDADLRSTAEVVIEAIDSTLWRVYARDPAVIDRIRHSYDDVRDVVPEIAISASHELS